jgi:tetratricopeptide (TPR) repeat protein
MARPIRELVPELPEALDRVVQWLMEKRRADRPQSAEEVARALEEIAGSALTLPGAGLALETGRSVGREAEHRKVWSLVGDATGVRLVLVSGGDGREQRRFAAQVASDAGRRSLRGVRIGPSEDPSRTIVAAFRSVALGQGSAAAARLLGVVGDGRGIVARSTASLGAYVVDDVAELIAEYDRATVLVLEDAEGLDAEAMSLLQGLAGACQRHKARLTVVATVSGPDSAAGTALRRVIAQVGTVFLAPLDVRATALTLGELLHRRPAPMELARLVHQRSQGHPSRVEATLRALVDDGAIAVRDDDENRIEWTGAAGEAIRFQTSLDDVEARLDRLPIVARRALEVLAIAGGRAGRKLLAAGLGWSESATELLADDLIERGVLRGAQASDELEAFDPVLLHTINLQLLPARRFVIHQLIADVIPLDPPTPAAVRTLLAVGRSEAALRSGLSCGLDMLQRGIIHEALALMEELSGAANHPGLESSVRAEYHLLLGRLVRAVRPMDPRSIRSIHAADRLVVAPSDKARVQEAYAELQAAIGHQGNYRKHLLAGWELAGPEGGGVAGNLALKLAWSRLNEGDLAQAVVWAGRARAAEPGLARRVSILDAAVDLLRGDLARADEVLQALIAGPTEDPVARWDATVWRAQVLRRQGRYSAALEPLERALEESRDGVSPVSWLRLLLAVGEVELDLARLGAAQERVDEALAAMFRGESLELRLSARLVHGRIQVASGQLAAARYVLNEVKEQADLAGLTLLAERARGALAEALWAVGQRKESMELFRRSIVRLMEVGDVVSLVDVVIARARAVGGLEEPAKSFKPVAGLLDRPEFRVLYLESCLAELRWARAKDDASGVARALAESQSVFNGMAARQARVEQAALRVHPWMRELRRALEK